MVTLVDTLQRLGIDNHFRHEVDAALKRINNNNSCESLGDSSAGSGGGGAADDGLHTVALRFRLLRQHGVWVPADVFDRFKDDTTGGFSESLSSDPRGLLSLYNAAHMATPGEQGLDEAISFARRHLESLNERHALVAIGRASVPCPRHPSRTPPKAAGDDALRRRVRERRGARRRALGAREAGL